MVSEAVTLELANRKHRLSDELVKIDDEIKAWLRYQQGCRCRYRSNILDALDSTHTLIQKVVIPRGVIAINSVKLNAYGHKFRAYESSSEAGGDDPFDTEETTPDSVTSGAAAPEVTGATTPDNTTSSTWTGNTNSGGVAHTHSVSISTPNTPNIGTLQRSLGSFLCSGGNSYFWTSLANPHSHIYGSGHTHTNQPASHTHTISHTHTVNYTAHSHQVNVPNHTHDLAYAIYEESSASVAVSLVVTDPDGVPHNVGSLGSGEFSKEDLELKEYFTMIGVYTFTFSADGLARITSIVLCDLVIEPE